MGIFSRFSISFTDGCFSDSLNSRFNPSKTIVNSGDGLAIVGALNFLNAVYSPIILVSSFFSSLSLIFLYSSFNSSDISFDNCSFNNNLTN